MNHGYIVILWYAHRYYYTGLSLTNDRFSLEFTYNKRASRIYPKEETIRVRKFLSSLGVVTEFEPV